MKNSTALLLAAGGLALIYGSRVATGVNTVNFVLNGVDLSDITNIKLQFLIQNVSNATGVLNSLSGNITVNGYDLGNISDFNAVTIPPNSQQPVNISLRPDLISLPQTIAALIQDNGSGNNALNFEIIGNANVNGIVLPFNLTKTINV